MNKFNLAASLFAWRWLGVPASFRPPLPFRSPDRVAHCRGRCPCRRFTRPRVGLPRTAARAPELITERGLSRVASSSPPPRCPAVRAADAVYEFTRRSCRRRSRRPGALCIASAVCADH